MNLNNKLSLRTGLEIAEVYAELKGLKWKIWMNNNKENTAGGIYLFETEEDAQEYIDSELFNKALTNNPRNIDLEVKMFDIIPELSKVTRAPI